MEHDDEDQIIEVEIQRQLDELLISHDEGESDTEEEMPEGFCDDQDDNGSMPQTLPRYFDIVNKRSENLQKDLDECQRILQETTHDCEDESFCYQSAEMKEIAFILGEDPEELRDRVLYEVEEEEDKTELNQILETTDTMQLVPVTMEHQACQQLLALDDKLNQQNADMKQELQQRLEQQASRDHERYEDRMKRRTQHEEELKQLQRNREILQAKAQDELDLESRKTQKMLEKYQADIEKFAKETRAERLEFEHRLAAEKQRREDQRLYAALLIQAVFRSYRVRKKYIPRLNRLKEKRKERRLQQRQMEIIASRRAEEQRKKKEKQDMKKKEEIERKRQEEIQKRAEEKRLEEERLEKEQRQQEKEKIERIEKEKLEVEKKREEEKIRREKDLEKQTQEILAKIQDEKVKSCGSPALSSDDVENVQTCTDKRRNLSQDESLNDAKNFMNTPCELGITDENTRTNADQTSSNSAQDQCLRDSQNVTNAGPSNNERNSLASVKTSENTQTNAEQKSSNSIQDECLHDSQNVTNVGPSNNERNSFASVETSSENTWTNNSEKLSDFAQDECLADCQNVVNASCESTDEKNQKSFGMEKDTEEANSSAQSESQNVVKLVGSETTEIVLEKLRLDRNDTTKLTHVDKTSNQQSCKENHVDYKSSNVTTSQASSHYTHRGLEDMSTITCETENRNLEPACPTKNGLCSSAIASGVDVMSKPNTDGKLCQDGTGSDATSLTGTKFPNSDAGVSETMDDIDGRRLRWMQNCASYRSPSNDTKHDESRRPLRKVPGVGKLPALTSMQLLAASQPHQKLAQVTVVIVENATPCSLCSLTACPILQCLHVQHSGVKLLEGLHQSSEITHVNLQDNQVEGIHCRDSPNLAQLILNNNKLTAVRGLEGCTKLRCLELAHNNITRTDGLASLTSITHLDLSHNQLVSISGIGHLVHLQDLNLSHNHLSTVSEVRSCCLLQRLDAQSNSLVEVPPLDNHVLLRDLRLDDNSLCQIDPLRQTWLPLLQFLSVSQNGLTDLPDLKYCVTLQKVDISQNCIADADVIIDALKDCHYLEELQILDNPVQQEDCYRHTLLGGLPQLRIVDGEVVQEPLPRQPRTVFDAMCLSQLTADDRLHAMHHRHAKLLTDDFTSRIRQESSTASFYFECSLQQALKHRRMHEDGNISEINPMSPDSVESIFREYLSSQRNSEKLKLGSPEYNDSTSDKATDVSRMDETRRMNEQVPDTRTVCVGRDLKTDHNQNLSSKHDIFSTCTCTRNSETGCVCENGRTAISLSEREISTSNIQHATTKSLPQKTNRSREAATTIIQAGWRGYTTRREIAVNAKRWLAALRIQTLWRGYVVRKRLASARQAALYVDSDNDDDSFGYDDVDPTSWDFTQTNIDADWLPAESPCIPMVAPRLPATPIQSNRRDADTDYHTRHPLKQAWHDATESSRIVRDIESPVSVVSKPPLPPVQTGLAVDTPRTVRSHRQDKITEEWGFKDSTTAELMMRRAKKLSRGTTNKKKMLDPLQRYQQMKKLHDSPKVVSSCKKGVQRQEFFQTREDSIHKVVPAQRKEKEHKAARTFEWVHSYGVINSDALKEHGRCSTSEPNLPRMSPTALQGRVQLTASPTLDLQSVDGDSSVYSSNRPRSQSLSTLGHERLRLPAVKTSSAPSERRKERQNEGTGF